MKLHRQIFVSSLLILTLNYSPILSQGKNAITSPKASRFDTKLPSIFISFERIGSVKNSLGHKDEMRIWLRLRNNSRWPIKLYASGGIKHLDDSKLYYDILDAKENVKVRRACHVCSTMDLARGKSILFSLPYEDLSYGESLRIQFAYPWEDELAVAPAREPTHYVFFYTRSLPSDNRSK